MYHFEYVSKKEAAPYKSQLIELLNRVQDYVRDEFTFQFTFIGSSSRNMITYDPTTKLISLFDCIFDHFIWRETTFISLRQKIFFAQNFTHTVIKLSQFYKISLFCISDNHRNLSLQLPICLPHHSTPPKMCKAKFYTERRS